jgi:hypothetical protein
MAPAVQIATFKSSNTYIVDLILGGNGPASSNLKDAKMQISPIPYVPRKAIEGQIARIVEYAKQHDSDKLPIRARLRDAVAALERDEFRLVHLDDDRRHGRRAP